MTQNHQEKLPSLFFVAANIQTHNTHLHCVQWIPLINQCGLRALASTTVQYRDSFSGLFIFKNRPAELHQHLNCFTWSYILSREDNQMQF